MPEEHSLVTRIESRILPRRRRPYFGSKRIQTCLFVFEGFFVYEELGVIPVVVLNDTKDALPLAKALVEGGLPCAEVTFRTEAAEESIRLMHEAYPDMVLAAGTVLTTEQVDRAVAAGASVIVSPGFDPEIVDYCISKNIPVMPGIVTPSELAQAVKRGLTRVKFFPATAAGGIKMIKAMCAAYTTVRIMPT